MCMHNLLPDQGDRVGVGGAVPCVAKRKRRYRVGQLLQCGLEAIVIQANLLLVFDASEHHKQNGEPFEHIGSAEGVYDRTLRTRSRGLDDDFLSGLQDVIYEHDLGLGDFFDEQGSFLELAKILKSLRGVGHLNCFSVQIKHVDRSHCYCLLQLSNGGLLND